jgi:hypothetical protein
MPKELHYDRRRFLRNAAVPIAAARLGMTNFADSQPNTTKPADLPTIKPGTNTSFGSLKQ